MAEGLKLTAGPGTGLDLEQSRGDPGDGPGWAGHGGPPQWARGVALVGFVILEAGADRRGCDGEHAGHSLPTGAGPAGLPVGGAQCRGPRTPERPAAGGRAAARVPTGREGGAALQGSGVALRWQHRQQSSSTPLPGG
jgi:hypothetical protein